MAKMEDNETNLLVQQQKDKIANLLNERQKFGELLRTILLQMDLLKECYRMKMESLSQKIIPESDFFTREVVYLVDLVSNAEQRFRVDQYELLSEEETPWPVEEITEPHHLVETKSDPPDSAEDYHEQSSTDVEGELDKDWSPKTPKSRRKKEKPTKTSESQYSWEEFGCQHCKASFISKEYYEQHMILKHGYPDKQSRNENDGDDDIEENFTCQICGAEFISLKFLENHVNIAHSKGYENILGQPFLCNEDNCGQEFGTRAEIIKHKERRHSLKKRHECRRCHQTFPDYASHRRHYESHRLKKSKKDMEQYVCSVCGVACRGKHSLKSHERTHLPYEERPHVCTTCNKRFTQNSSLKIHIRTHTGELSHLCSICGAGFTSSAHLHAHRKQHSAFKAYVCTHCGKAFRRLGEMRNHELRHRNERNFLCPVCGKAFYSTNDLKRHSQTHLAVKRVRCPYCSMTFSQVANMRGHVRRIHGIVIEPMKPNQYEIVPEERLRDSMTRKNGLINNGDHPGSSDQ